MFNEIHSYNDLLLTFIKSVNIQAFPCGRRSSASSYDANNNGQIADNEKFYFPFDPEARLSTEANTRKHSSLNGFTQTYLKEWDYTDKKMLTMSLAGYLFNIALTGKHIVVESGKQVERAFDYSQPSAFGEKLFESLQTRAQKLLTDANSSNSPDKEDKIAAATAVLNTINSATQLYANILLEDVHLFSSTANEYFTSILRDQYDTAGADLEAKKATPGTLLDLLNRATAEGTSNLDARKDPNNYYFSGLSFSTVPLTGNTTDARSSLPITVERIYMPGEQTTQLYVSLRILERTKTSGDGVTPETFTEWQICQSAYLPKIEHGTTEDSIIIYGDTTLKGSNKELKVEGSVDVAVNLNATSITVPYTGAAEGDTTEINSDGISAPFIYANLINADGIAVNDEIGITDKNDKTKVITSIGANISTDGNITAKGNIDVEDNINVGDLADNEKATTDKGGCIVAKNDITAKRDLTAEENLYVEKNAEIAGDTAVKKSLAVGPNVAPSATAGTITAETHIETPTLNVSNKLTALNAEIGTAEIDNVTVNETTTVTGTVEISDGTVVITNDSPAKAKISNVTIDNTINILTTANVQNSTGTAKLNVDKADVTEATIDKTSLTEETSITGTLTVTNSSTDKAKIDNVTINNTIDVLKAANIKNTAGDAQLNVDNVSLEGTFTALTDLKDADGNPISNITAHRATVTTLNATTANVTGTANVNTLNGNDIQQKIGENYCDVPVMFIKKDGDKYQLQLSRVNKVGF